MKSWFTRLLVTVLVVTGVFVAIASGCQTESRVAVGGGSCSETRFEPFIPFMTANDIVATFVRLDLYAILVAVVILVVPTVARSATTNLLTRSYGIPKRIQLMLRD